MAGGGGGTDKQRVVVAAFGAVVADNVVVVVVVASFFLYPGEPDWKVARPAFKLILRKFSDVYSLRYNISAYYNKVKTTSVCMRPSLPALRN